MLSVKLLQQNLLVFHFNKTFSFLFYHLSQYLILFLNALCVFVIQKADTHTHSDLSFIISLSRCMQQTELDPAEVRNLVLLPSIPCRWQNLSSRALIYASHEAYQLGNRIRSRAAVLEPGTPKQNAGLTNGSLITGPIAYLFIHFIINSLGLRK